MPDVDRQIRLEDLWNSQVRDLAPKNWQQLLGGNALGGDHDPTAALIGLQGMNANPLQILRFLQLGHEMHPGTTDDVVMQVIQQILGGTYPGMKGQR